MDVKRLQLWENRMASVISNDTIKAVIEDQGSIVLELSNLTNNGGRVNAHPLPYFRGTQHFFDKEYNQAFWQNRPLLYYLGGNFFCFPNYGPAQQVGEVYHPEHGFAATEMWSVQKYGTDGETGANWILFKMVSPNEDYPFVAFKIEMMLPSHPVLYSSVIIKNLGSKDIIANSGWHNSVGSPFLETGSIIDLSADYYSVSPLERSLEQVGRLKPSAEFDDLSKAPLRNGQLIDLKVVPSVTGTTDFVTGKIPDDAKLGYASVLNPRMKMVYFTFFTGPAASTDEDEIILNFNNLSMQYGGRPFTPYALYDGGTDYSFSVGLQDATGYYNLGLKESLGNPTLFGKETTITIKPQQTRTLRYGTAFTSYENPKMDGGIQEVEQVVEGLVLKRGKAWTLIESDSIFHFLKEFEKKLLE